MISSVWDTSFHRFNIKSYYISRGNSPLDRIYPRPLWRPLVVHGLGQLPDFRSAFRSNEHWRHLSSCIHNLSKRIGKIKRLPTYGLARLGSLKTACNPDVLPSVITANATLFCRRTDFIQPLTWREWLFGKRVSNCRIVGGKVEAKRRNMTRNCEPITNIPSLSSYITTYHNSWTVLWRYWLNRNV